MKMQMTNEIVEIQDHNLYVSESNIDRIYEGGKLRSVVIPQSRVVEIRDQNLFGSILTLIAFTRE